MLLSMAMGCLGTEDGGTTDPRSSQTRAMHTWPWELCHLCIRGWSGWRCMLLRWEPWLCLSRGRNTGGPVRVLHCE